MKSIQVAYTFNDKNYHGAYKEHLKHRQKLWIYGRSLLCVLIILFGAYLLIYGQEEKTNELLSYIFICGGSLGFMRPMIWQMWHERGVRKNPAYNTKLQFFFKQEGVSVIGNEGKVELKWEQIMDLHVTAKGVLVYPDPKRFLWVPKSAFEEGEMEGVVAFKTLIGKS